MKSQVTIIMYHYVRDLKHSRYPEIKGLSVGLFKEQLKYIMKYYNVIRMEDLIKAIDCNKELPDTSLLLTFDDAYKDHFEFVFPILDELGIQGSFFPPAKAIQEHKVLAVNKIHFVLAACSNKKQIIDDIYSMLDKLRERGVMLVETNEYYYNKLAKENRFDPKEIVFIKRVLQKELPEKVRNIIIDRLFSKYVSKNEGLFSRELYMNIAQLKCMRRNGMYIGSHGFGHYWLSELSRDKQEEEIDLSLTFLKEIGCDVSAWVMCYPYGAYSNSLISLLKMKGCKLALSTNVGIAELNKENIFAFPRLDANDLPKDSNARPNEWFLKLRQILPPPKICPKRR